MSKLLRILTLGGSPFTGAGFRLAGAVDGVWYAFTDPIIRQWTGSAWLNRDLGVNPGACVDFAWFADNNVWWMGSYDIYHWNGTLWSLSLHLDDSGADTEGVFVGFGAEGATALYAVVTNLQTGTSPPIAHGYRQWAGTSWGGFTTVTTSFFGLSALRAHKLNSATVLRVGIQFSRRIDDYTTPTIPEYAAAFTSGTIEQFYLAGTSTGWAVVRGSSVTASGGEVLAYSGTWASMGLQPSYSEPDVTIALYGVDGSSSSSVWVVGQKGYYDLDGNYQYGYEVQRWDGSAWTRHTVDTLSLDPKALQAVRVFSATDVWVGGYRTAGAALVPTAWHWNGTTWTDRSPTV